MAAITSFDRGEAQFLGDRDMAIAGDAQVQIQDWAGLHGTPDWSMIWEI